MQTDVTAHLDCEFLTGWIELRHLGRAADAATHFAALTRESRSAITTGRGFYWLGRAAEAQGRGEAARDFYAQAAQRPNSFYGQAAIRALGPGGDSALEAAISGQREPGWTQAEAIRFASLELARAATLLMAWNDPRHARAFLLRLDESADSDPGHANLWHALGADFADRLGLPDVAVAIARNAGRHGLILARSGWPAPFTPPAEPALPPGLALAVMRQESSFDPQVVSPAGALGLMQLMPATARVISGTPVDAADLSQPGLNMGLGSRYLADLLGRFGGTVPFAVAAYNAGPSRVTQWLAQNGSPDAGSAAMIDWIEMIPFSETRNYVQRVLESQAIYRLRPRAAS